MVFQNQALYPHMSVYENLASAGCLEMPRPKSTASQRQRGVGPASCLGGGDAVRGAAAVALGRAGSQTGLFLFDEPLNATRDFPVSRIRAKIYYMQPGTRASVTDQGETMALAVGYGANAVSSGCLRAAEGLPPAHQPVRRHGFIARLINLFRGLDHSQSGALFCGAAVEPARWPAAARLDPTPAITSTAGRSGDRASGVQLCFFSWPDGGRRRLRHFVEGVGGVSSVWGRRMSTWPASAVFPFAHTGGNCIAWPEMSLLWTCTYTFLRPSGRGRRSSHQAQKRKMGAGLEAGGGRQAGRSGRRPEAAGAGGREAGGGGAISSPPTAITNRFPRCASLTRFAGTESVPPSRRLLLWRHVATAAAADWPQWRGPGRTGVSFEKFPAPAARRMGPKNLWRAELGTGITPHAYAEAGFTRVGNAAEPGRHGLVPRRSLGKLRWKRHLPWLSARVATRAAGSTHGR
jgi:hypothetical protein